MERKTRSKKQNSMSDTSLSSISDISLSITNENSFYLPDTNTNNKCKKEQNKLDESVFSLNDFDSNNFDQAKQEQQEEVEIKIEEDTEEMETLSIVPPQYEAFDDQNEDPVLVGIQSNLSMSVKEDDNEELNDPLEKQRMIKQNMMEIDRQIKKLSADKNRLKHQLKICGNLVDGEDNIQMKACVCCGKEISKLCFRCEHLYCKPQTCPRKKKQALNARMLEKMREKKETSKKTQLERKKRDKKVQKAYLPQVDEEEEQQQFNNSSSNSLQISINSSEESTQKKSRLKETANLNESELLSDINESGLYFDADE